MLRGRKRPTTPSREFSLGHGQNLAEDHCESHVEGYGSSQARGQQGGKWKQELGRLQKVPQVC